VTPIPGHQTASPSPSISATLIPSARTASPNPSISTTPIPTHTPDSAGFLALKGMKMDILYLKGDKEMFNYAEKIQRQLVSNHGLNKNKM
jgi:hypothetical protein